MAGLVTALRGLQPYLLNDEAFAARGNAAAVRLWLGTLSTNVQGLHHGERASGAAFAVSARVLESQVDHGLTAYEAGRPADARRIVQQTMRACIACHSQSGSIEGSVLLDIPAMPNDEVGRANLLFATRQFDAAVTAYRLILLGTNWQPYALTAERRVAFGISLERYLMLRLRVAPDLQGLAEDLLALRSRDGVPADVVTRLNTMLAAIGSRNLLMPFNPERSPSSRLLDWTGLRCAEPLGIRKTTYDSKHTVRMLLATGALYAFLDRSPQDPGVPRALLQLARCEAALGRNYLVPMSDLFLEECVRRVPHTAQARLCEGELEAYLARDDAGLIVPWNAALLAELRALAAPPRLVPLRPGSG